MPNQPASLSLLSKKRFTQNEIFAFIRRTGARKAVDRSMLKDILMYLRVD